MISDRLVQGEKQLKRNYDHLLQHNRDYNDGLSLVFRGPRKIYILNVCFTNLSVICRLLVMA